MSKQRLINANTLVGVDGLFATRGCTGNCECCNLWSEEGCRVILEAPTVDAVEVVHGRWEKHEPDKCGNRKPKCSVCGEYPLAWWSEYRRCKYCPHCGAKMDGEKHD